MPESFVTETLYFETRGPKNTEALMKAALKRAGELDLKNIVIASRSGRTAEEALKHFDPKKYTLIVVSYVTGFADPDQQQMAEETRAELKAKGLKIVTAAHAFGGVGRGVRNKLGSYQVDEIMAHTLRMLGQGVKVGVEIALMATDRGFVRTDEDILTIAGSGKGADTAMVIQPANSHQCLDLKIREIIAKPWHP